MKRGQTTLEYVLLIGIVAAGIIAMIVYVSRGHQGNLRSQADQLSAGQYAPGNTVIIDNRENKNLASIASSGSQTKTEHPEHDVNQPNTDLDTLLLKITNMWAYIYGLMQERDLLAESEGITGAEWARANGLPWNPPSPNLAEKIVEIDNAFVANEMCLSQPDCDALDTLNAKALTAEANWPEREPNKTTTTSYSSEKGTITTNKKTDETLGDL
jgi:Flp pilus assembly pilin Flp